VALSDTSILVISRLITGEREACSMPEEVQPAQKTLRRRRLTSDGNAIIKLPHYDEGARRTFLFNAEVTD
jgi:hypothetical protein